MSKNKVYKVQIEQSFNYCWREWKWYRMVLKTERYTSEEDICAKYILASSENEAIEKYKERYKWTFDYPLDRWWNYKLFGMFEKGSVSINPDWKHEVKAKEVHLSFDELKRELRSDELLAYCKQELYPIEVLIQS